MARPIEHSGVVERTAPDAVYVRITSRSACGACRARQACGLAETQENAALGWSEGASALAALGGVGLYYVVLWLCRRRIEHTIHFTITKI